MTDVFPLLPRLQWRGRTYPVIERSVSFLHENIEHRIQYRENDFSEPVGPHSFLFKYTIPMREDLAKGPYKNLFNEGLYQLVRDMRNREPGDLLDPVMGLFRCVPTSYSETTDVNKRDGTDVQIELIHSPRLEDSEPEFNPTVTGITGLVGESGLLDSELALQDWKQEPSPNGVTDVISAINGFGQQGLRKIDKLSSQMDALGLKMQKVSDTADASENPQNWRIRDSARQVQYDAIRIKNRVSENPADKVSRVTTKAVTTVSVMAKDAGMTIADFLKLNPSLARSPVIRPGTKISVVRKNPQIAK